MEKLNELIDQLGLELNLPLEEIPKIDLYMDQVIQLFESKFAASKRNDEEKVLTKTMINNYAKGKLIFPINNKKYTKEHLILISFIYQLKGALSISDIKTTLDGVNMKVLKDDIDLDTFYTSFLNLTSKNVDDFKVDLNKRAQVVEEEIADGQEGQSPDLERVLMISSLVHMSNLYRKAAEKLVDGIIVETEGKRQK